jgi:hypothetical protein
VHHGADDGRLPPSAQSIDRPGGDCPAIPANTAAGSQELTRAAPFRYVVLVCDAARAALPP